LVKNGTWIRWLLFVLGPLPQAIRLASFTGTPWTKAFEYSFALSWVLMEVVIFAAEEQSSTHRAEQDNSMNPSFDLLDKLLAL
jgi:hypothetical protein